MNIHWAKPLDWREAACGYAMTPDDHLPTSNKQYVNCPDCLNIISRQAEQALTPLTWEKKLRRDWTVAAVGGDTDLGLNDWLREQGVGTPTPPLHTPPRMVNGSGVTDGVFRFYGTHSDLGGQMEVVPMSTGNVEFTISSDESQKDGLVFSLNHLDRADMLRVLLYDFHYSPEVGGPGDDQD